MKYISVKKHWLEMYEQYSFYEIQKKFPINKIQIKPLRNKVDQKEVLYMLMNFDREAWEPITLDTDYFLVDGQHRLELAREFGMEFIDTVVLDDNKLF